LRISGWTPLISTDLASFDTLWVSFDTLWVSFDTGRIPLSSTDLTSSGAWAGMCVCVCLFVSSIDMYNNDVGKRFMK
jgi:hypothetical protein